VEKLRENLSCMSDNSANEISVKFAFTPDLLLRNHKTETLK